MNFYDDMFFVFSHEEFQEHMSTLREEEPLSALRRSWLPEPAEQQNHPRIDNEPQKDLFKH
jgi:hypothetical protein